MNTCIMYIRNKHTSVNGQTMFNYTSSNTHVIDNTFLRSAKMIENERKRNQNKIVILLSTKIIKYFFQINF